jgi:hypothetical protein
MSINISYTVTVGICIFISNTPKQAKTRGSAPAGNNN